MPDVASTVGLCATCVHSRVITNRRGSTFWYCRKSETDARFPRYPPLPVHRCSGYEPRTDVPEDPA